MKSKYHFSPQKRSCLVRYFELLQVYLWKAYRKDEMFLLEDRMRLASLFNPVTHCTFDVVHLIVELWISTPKKYNIIQIWDDSRDVWRAD